jgi:hypothetical protein
MSKRIQIGGCDFGELIRKDLLFVDKTLFIKEILDDQSKVTIITRPRRWGKTLGMSMLQHFLSAEVVGQKTAGLFDHLLIATVSGNYIEQHQGKYPVVFISFKDIKQLSFESVVASISLLIQKTYSEHRYLTRSSQFEQDEQDFFQRALYAKLSLEELTGSLQKLSEWLVRYHGKKTYILIDEYDTPMNFAYAGKNYFEEISLFMKNFLSASLKDNVYLEKGIMTGILRISKDSMLSGLNNPEIYTVLRDKLYAPYFGFTDNELDALFTDQNLAKNEAEVKAWYNGYSINGLTLYNPWSIMNCLKNQADLMPYWVNTGDDSLLKELLQNSSAKVKDQFRSLILDQSVEVLVNQTMRFDQIKTDTSMLWNLLLSAGYLKALTTNTEGRSYRCQVAIPNREVMSVYQGIFLQWLASDASLELKSFITLLGEGKITEFAKNIEHFLKMAASVHDYAQQPEAFYHGFMLALSVSLTDHYYVFSNHESGLGRPDLIIIPKDTQKSQAVILEFKTVTDNQQLNERAKEALAQIQERDYARSILQQYNYIKTVLQVGMAFDGKTVFWVEANSSK